MYTFRRIPLNFETFFIQPEYLPGMDVPVMVGDVEDPPKDVVTQSWFSDDAIGDNEIHNPGEVHHISDESGNVAHHMDNCKLYCKLSNAL